MFNWSRPIQPHFESARFEGHQQTPTTIGAAETEAELLESLSCGMRALFPGLLRFELYLADRSGRMGIASRLGPPRPARAIGGTGPLRAQIFSDVCADADLGPARRGPSRGTAMCAPVMNGREPLGLIMVDAPRGKDFKNVDLQILEGVAAVCSLAFQRIRTRHVDRLLSSVELDRKSAPRVQRRLMGQLLPAGSRVKADVQYLPALDVGGDFYEVSCLGDGRVVGAIGDVSGKGVSAALIMSRVSSDVRRGLRSGTAPSRVLQDVNEALSDIESDTFVTATCISIDTRLRTLTLSNAGHIPLIVRRDTGEVFDFGPASGTPLGVMPCEYADERLDLLPNDIILMMTDGLVDALDCPSDRSVSRRIHRLVADAPHDAASINAMILAAANDASGDRARDDVTLVALQLDQG
jgi:sigma-B regulation protein RsbU (phosphoserine phosphatase)